MFGLFNPILTTVTGKGLLIILRISAALLQSQCGIIGESLVFNFDRYGPLNSHRSSFVVQIIEVWGWILMLKFEVEFKVWSLHYSVWGWNLSFNLKLNLKFGLEVQIGSFNFKFLVRVWGWSLNMKFKVVGLS